MNIPANLNLPLSIEWWVVPADTLLGFDSKLTDEPGKASHAQIVDSEGALLLYCDSNDEYGFGQDEIDRLQFIVDSVNCMQPKGTEP